MTKNIYWCGASLNYEGLNQYKGEAPSATQWITGFITGLENNSAEVNVFAPIWDAYFPKGKLVPGNKKHLDKSFNQKLVRYLNLPYLRNLTASYSLYKKMVQTIKEKGNPPQAILNYNTYPHYVDAIKRVKKTYPNILWINVILDLDDPEKDNWQKFLNDTSGASANIFLSWWGYNNAPGIKKLHLDCGWSGNLPKYKINHKKIIVYAGKMAEYGGINTIIEAIRLVKDPNVVFKFFGKGTNNKLTALAKIDCRIKVNGFVTDEELQSKCENAYAFLSPREMSHQGNKMIFPSKILYYLTFRKPVISPILPGVAPDYYNLLVVPKEDSIQAWADSINDVLDYSSSEQNTIKTKTEQFLDSKTWKKQGESLLLFIETLSSN